MKLHQTDLAVIKAELCRSIDAAAEAVRGQYLTPGAGQAMVYLQKRTEAAAYLADNEAHAPHILAEAAMTGQTAEDIAEEIIATADQWQTISSMIEAKRQGAKKSVMAAETVAEARIAAQVAWA